MEERAAPFERSQAAHEASEIHSSISINSAQANYQRVAGARLASAYLCPSLNGFIITIKQENKKVMTPSSRRV